MNTTALITPPQAPYADHLGSDPGQVVAASPDSGPSADQGRTDVYAGASAGRDSAALLDLWPIWPFMLLVALAVLAFAPLFAAVALVALAGAIIAAPFLLILRLVGRG